MLILQVVAAGAIHGYAIAQRLQLISRDVVQGGRVLVPGNDVSDVASVPLALLAGQSLLLASVLSGFRHAVRIPAELRASTTFSLAWAGNLTPYISGVKLAGWIALVLPTLGGLFIWHATVLGTRLAALHLGVGLVVSALVMEMLFLRDRRVPFVSGYVPGLDVKLRGIVFLVAVVSVSFALASAERFALTATAGYLTLVAIMVGLSAGVMAVDRAARWPATPSISTSQPRFPPSDWIWRVESAMKSI